MRGHHVYQRIWTPTLGEELHCEREDANSKDPCAVAVIKGRDTVGHVHRRISAACSLFLRFHSLVRRLEILLRERRTASLIRERRLFSLDILPQSHLSHTRTANLRTGAEPRKRASTIARKTLAYFYFGDSNIDRQIAKFTGYTVF